MILDTWQNPAMARCKRLPVFAYSPPTIPTRATLEEILAIAEAYRATLAKPPAQEELTHDPAKLA